MSATHTIEHRLPAPADFQPTPDWMARFAAWRADQPEFAELKEALKAGAKLADILPIASRAGVTGPEAEKIATLAARSRSPETIAAAEDFSAASKARDAHVKEASELRVKIGAATNNDQREPLEKRIALLQRDEQHINSRFAAGRAAAKTMQQARLAGLID